MSLPRWSFGAGISSITAVADYSDILTVEQIQYSTWDAFNPVTVGRQQGCGLCFLAFSIYSCTSGSATLRSVHCCQTDSTAKQNCRSLEWLTSCMPFSEGGETGKAMTSEQMCSDVHCQGNGVFNSISNETLALNTLGTALKCNPLAKQDVSLKLQFRLKLQPQQ